MPAITIPNAASAPALYGHLAVPADGCRPWPGVVVLHEGFGLADDVREHTDRFAAAGFLGVAPDLYTAGGARRCMLATIRALLRGGGTTFEDIDAARRWLAARDDCTGPHRRRRLLHGGRLCPAYRDARVRRLGSQLPGGHQATHRRGIPWSLSNRCQLRRR